MRGTPYPTLDGLVRAARSLVAARPGTLRLRVAGTSRAGEPLWLLSAGHGSRQVLTVAGAHANEPVGGASSLRLAGEFARDPAVLEALDCTWNLLLCLDPDGTRLGERWMTARPPGAPSSEPESHEPHEPREPQEPREPYELRGSHEPREPWTPTVEEYFRGFYRPDFGGHPEFPPAAGDPRPPIPESRALMALIDDLRPVVQFSLHGVDVGGSFLQLTRSMPGVPEAFRAVVAELGVPLEHRPFDGMEWFVDSPGVLVRPEGAPDDDRDPSGFTSQSTWLYPMRYGAVSAVVEAPLWGVAAVGDPSPVADPERAIARAADVLLSRTKELEEALGGRAHRPPRDARGTPYYTAARELMDIGPGVVGTWTTYDARGLGGSALAATAGNAASLGIAARRIPLRAAAMMRQAFTDAPEGTAALDALVRDWSHELTTTFGARWLPVHRQTSLHLRTMRHVAARLLTGRPPAR